METMSPNANVRRSIIFNILFIYCFVLCCSREAKKRSEEHVVNKALKMEVKIKREERPKVDKDMTVKTLRARL